MNRILRPSFLAFMLMLALVISGTPALACGPFSLEAIFVFTVHPEFPLENFARGNLGGLGHGLQAVQVVVVDAEAARQIDLARAPGERSVDLGRRGGHVGDGRIVGEKENGEENRKFSAQKMNQ